MVDNIIAGADRMSDKGYELSTHEEAGAFANKRTAVLTEYRDHTMEDFIYFWTIKNIRVSGIYATKEQATSWDGKIDITLT